MNNTAKINNKKIQKDFQTLSSKIIDGVKNSLPATVQQTDAYSASFDEVAAIPFNDTLVITGTPNEIDECVKAAVNIMQLNADKVIQEALK